MPKLVFIIDDDVVYLKLMKDHFRQTDEYVLESYSDGEEALLHLKSKAPYLIILDHNLAHQWKDGLFYLKEIKKVRSDVPVFYITSDASPTLEAQARKAGAQQFIKKDPASLMHLRMALDGLAKPKPVGFFSKLFKNG
jgi:DNA-binding NtrC family response regulator